MTSLSRRSLPGVVALAILLLTPPPAGLAAVVPTGFSDQLVLGGLDAPSGFTFLPDGQRMLIVEQNSARIRMLNVNGPLSNLAQVTNVSITGEEGLLGIAVDPGWPARNYIYVQYTTNTGVSISRFTVTGDLSYTGSGLLAIDVASKMDLLTDPPNNSSNHNGGTLRFGKDGMLYSSLGEDAVRCAAQDTISLRGVILRLDVTRLPATGIGPPPKSLLTPLSGNPFADNYYPNARLVWALGFRNPFRFHVDMQSGDLFIGDVGENEWEEVDRAPFGVGGMNFGWPDYEGPDPLANSCTDQNSSFVAPIGYYNRTGFTAAVISAGLYRRPATGADRFPPIYEGDYFYSDYFSGFLRRMKGSGNSWSTAPQVPGQPSSSNWGTGFEHVSDWAVGSTGALWYCKQSNAAYADGTGEIRRITFPQPLSVPQLPVLLPPLASPAIETAMLPFTLVTPGVVTMRLYDLSGRQIRTLIDGEMHNAGPQTPAYWDGRDDNGRPARAGVYTVRLTVDGAHTQRRFALIH